MPISRNKKNLSSVSLAAISKTHNWVLALDEQTDFARHTK